MILISFVFRFLKFEFEIPILALATGLYLPFSLSTPILIGGFMGFVSRKLRNSFISDEIKRSNIEQSALLFIAGLISGESLTGVLIAIPVGITQNKDFFAIFGKIESIWASIPVMIFVLSLFFFIAIGGFEICTRKKIEVKENLSE